MVAEVQMLGGALGGRRKGAGVLNRSHCQFSEREQKARLRLKCRGFKLQPRDRTFWWWRVALYCGICSRLGRNREISACDQINHFAVLFLNIV
jgi:hypothetical protein